MFKVAQSTYKFTSTGVYFLQVKNGNSSALCGICSKLTIKTPEQCHWRSSVLIVNFEQISHIVLFPYLTWNK